jgi:hypothetical protein
MKINPQSAWEKPGEAIDGPSPKGKPEYWVIHYPGSTSSYEPMTDDEMIKTLQQGQAQYLRDRGYSYGYSVVVSQSGSAWAARGLEGFPGVRVYNPASNPGKKRQDQQGNTQNFNAISRSIQIAVGAQNEASPAAVKTVNEIIATQDWPVLVHSDVDYTACAGEGVTAQVRTGVIGHQITGITPDRIKAEPGDGGWSLMRKLGIDPTNAQAAREFYDRNYIVYPDVWIYKPE